MKPHLKFRRGYWFCGEKFDGEFADLKFFLWACSARTVREACALWRPINTDAAAVSAVNN